MSNTIDNRVQPSPATRQVKTNVKKKVLKIICSLFLTTLVSIIIALIVGTAVIVGYGLSILSEAFAEKSLGSPCSTGSECNRSQKLICTNGTCGCDVHAEYSDGMCKETLLGRECSSNSSCGTNNNLSCHNGTCSCSLASFFNGTSCVTKRSFNSSCQSNTQCQQLNRLECVDSMCVCISNNYWNGSICATQQSFNDSCSSNQICNTKSGLICASNRLCSCPPNYYWNEITCEVTLGIHKTCSSHNQCDDSRFLICSSGTCKCNSTIDSQGNVAFYSSEARVCLKCPNGWRLLGQFCFSINRTLMTQPQAKSHCESFDAHLLAIKNQDELMGLFFFYLSLRSNVPAWVGIESFSPGTYRRHFDGTFLSKNISWWETGRPRSVFPFNTCVVIGTNDKFSLIEENCVAVRRMPFCQKYATPCGLRTYWNGSLCMPAKGISESCNLNFECNQAQSLICIDGICNCNMSTYRHGDSCFLKLGINMTCTNSDQCDDSNFLNCYNGRCGCNSIADSQGNVELYSNETKGCLKCPNGWTLSGGSCLFAGTTHLMLRQAKSFCESFGAHLFAPKNQNEINMFASFGSPTALRSWIGIESTSRFTYRRHSDRTIVNANSIFRLTLSHGHPSFSCANVGLVNPFTIIDMMCSVLRYAFCQKYTSPCADYTFWNGSQCVPKKAFNAVCNDNTECDHTQSLICIDGRCLCNMTTYRSGDGTCLPMRQYGNNYYMFNTTRVNQLQAIDYCKSLGLWLYTPNTRDEHEWIMNVLINNRALGDVWTGCTNANNIGSTNYTCQGTPNPSVLTTSENFWCTGEPSAPSQQLCVATRVAHGFNCIYLEDSQCTALNMPVCEDDPF